MKKLSLLLVLSGGLIYQSALAQNDAGVKLSSQYPAVGEKITVSYNPTGTVIESQQNISATVYYLDNKDFPAVDVPLKSDGGLFKGELSIPANTKAFFIRFSADDKIDNNGDKGYIYTVYKGKQPVEGAYAMEGYMLTSGMGQALANVKTNLPAGTDLYKKEFAAYPQSEKEYQSLYYSLMLRNPENKALVEQKISSLGKSLDEKDLMFATTLLRQTKNTKGADSLNAIIKAKFPDGTVVKNESAVAFQKEKDLQKKDALYNEYIAKYPEKADEKNAIQDIFRVQLAAVALQNSDFESFDKYAKQVKNKINLVPALNNAAYDMAKKGERLDKAEQLSKQAMDIISARIANPTEAPFSSLEQVKKNSQSQYNTNADTYAFILYKENKFAEALTYEKPVVDNSKRISGEVYEHYVLILGATGQYAKAKEVAETAVETGQSSEALKDELKKDYIKVKGNDNGYDQYLASLVSISQNKVKVEMAKTMINKPAPVFALKDIDGKLVSLKDFKGKTVIVDFWATWCGPCKASFPGMQMAVNKYKDDPNVVFLFVDTWETADNYLDGVKKFIADTKYPFHVLMDEKVASGKQEKVISTFGVEGIPTKFIIDKNGNIRFKYVGYSGSSDKVLEEVVAMVELAGNADIVSSQVK